MADRVEVNRQRQLDLFSGPHPGHCVVFDPPTAMASPGDYTTSAQPVRDWVPSIVANYRAWQRWVDELGDDGVPVAMLGTHTGVFAEAFGCRIQPFEGSNAAAMPFVTCAAEAAALPRPDFTQSRSLSRFWELAELVRFELGPDVPLSGPDIQSPFDIAALVWHKEQMFYALVDEPEAVLDLVERCEALLTGFLDAFRREFPQQNVIHCPLGAFAPPALGCSLSEDEVGSLSPAMFERFCQPTLTRLSERYGGLFMHCCANADPHYEGFRRIPGLRGLNRVFQVPPGPGPALATFEPSTVFMVAWTGETGVRELLDLAGPGRRFLFDMGHAPLDQAQRSLATIRGWCG